jgi:hypothetical protein
MRRPSSTISRATTAARGDDQQPLVAMRERIVSPTARRLSPAFGRTHPVRLPRVRKKKPRLLAGLCVRSRSAGSTPAFAASVGRACAPLAMLVFGAVAVIRLLRMTLCPPVAMRIDSGGRPLVNDAATHQHQRHDPTCRSYKCHCLLPLHLAVSTPPQRRSCVTAVREHATVSGQSGAQTHVDGMERPATISRRRVEPKEVNRNVPA